MRNTNRYDRSVKALLELYQELRLAEHSRGTDFEVLNNLDATIEAIENGDACPLLTEFSLGLIHPLERATRSDNVNNDLPAIMPRKRAGGDALVVRGATA